MLRSALLASLLCAIPGLALAQEPRDDERLGSEETEAASLAQAGYAALLGGRFEPALEHFRAAYALHDDPYYLLDIARACDALRRDADARAAYREYLQRAPNSRRRPEIEARIRAIEHALRTRPIPSDEDEAEAAGVGTVVQPGYASWDADDDSGWIASEGAAADRRRPVLPPPPASDPVDDDAGYPTWMWTIAGISVGAAVVAVFALILVSGDEATPSRSGLSSPHVVF